MSGEDAIKVEGRVVEVLPKTLYRVELANGHRLMAHVGGRARPTIGGINMGDKVMVQMSPYDLSKGCIIFRAN